MLGNIKLRKLNSNLRGKSFKAKSTFPKTYYNVLICRTVTLYTPGTD